MPTDKQRERLRGVYHCMKDRCYNPSDPNYARYGARGITICDEWLNDSQKFYSWSYEHGYQKGLSIDRIDNSKGYSPNNCRWADRVTQANNTRSNRIVEYKGESDTLANWCRKLNMPYNRIVMRLNRGWSPERAFETEPQYNEVRIKHQLTYKGKTKSMVEWGKELGIPYDKLNSRIYKLKWSVEDAFEK